MEPGLAVVAVSVASRAVADATVLVVHANRAVVKATTKWKAKVKAEAKAAAKAKAKEEAKAKAKKEDESGDVNIIL